MKQAAAFFLVILLGCDKNKSEDPPNRVSEVSTGATFDITTTSAKVQGSLNKIGTPASTEYGIVWALSILPTTANNKVAAGTATTASGVYQVSLTVLSPNSTYYVRAYATNAAGTTYGLQASFQTASRNICELTSLPGTLSNGLVLYMPFCGNANDRSTFSNHGTVTGAQPGMDRFGHSNAAYNFNGTSDKITVPDHASLNTGTFSVSVWYKTSNFSNHQWLLQKSNWADGNNVVYTVAHNLGAPGFLMGRYKIGSGCQRQLGWTDVAHLNSNSAWHHIVVTNDGIAGKLYFDGALVNTNTAASGLTDICPGGTLTIGAGWASDPGWWNGLIDDVAVYNRALTASEVLALYQ